MQRAFHKIICISAGFEVQAAGISLRTEIKTLRLTWSWACWTSFTHHTSAKLSKPRALLVRYLLSHKSNSTHPLPFIFLNKWVLSIYKVSFFFFFFHGAECSLGNWNSLSWKINWSNIFGIFGPDADCIFFWGVNQTGSHFNHRLDHWREIPVCKGPSWCQPFSALFWHRRCAGSTSASGVRACEYPFKLSLQPVCRL